MKRDIVPRGEKLQIDWFTGILVIPYGKLVSYVHMGYGSTFSNYLLLEVEKGVVKKEKRMDFKEYELFKNKQFEAFRKTDEYKELMLQLTKDGSSPEMQDQFLRYYIINYTSKFRL